MDGSWSAQPKRRSLRAPIDVPVAIQRGATRLQGRTLNLGFGGAFIETSESLAYGEEVTLWIPILHPHQPSPVRSLVRWRSNSGFGVQFLELGAREAHAVGQLIRGSNDDERLTLTDIEAELLVGEPQGLHY